MLFGTLFGITHTYSIGSIIRDNVILMPSSKYAYIYNSNDNDNDNSNKTEYVYIYIYIYTYT